MERRRHWRVTLLGRGNLVIGIATPVVLLINILGALKVFSIEWAAGSIVIASLVGSILGYLTWRSGRALLRGDPAAFGGTCVAGGLSLGYTVAGIWIMTTAGIDRGLEILIRHGSEDWWNWSLSHFQNSSLREIPLMAWWVLGLGTILRYRLAGAPEKTGDRMSSGLWRILPCALAGGIARIIQLAQDTLLASQR
jgi:hypothetical protein